MLNKKIDKDNHPTKKEMEEYIEFLNEAAKNFKLKEIDLSNLFDLFYMIMPEYESTLKLNKMEKWFKEFFSRLDKVVMADSSGEYKEILKQLKENNNGKA